MALGAMLFLAIVMIATVLTMAVGLMMIMLLTDSHRNAARRHTLATTMRTPSTTTTRNNRIARIQDDAEHGLCTRIARHNVISCMRT